MVVTRPEEAGGRREESGVPPGMRGWVSRIVRVGLLVASVLMLIGVAGFLARGIGLGSPGSVVSFDGSFPGAFVSGDPAAFALAGLVVLMLTPLSRVALSVALFASAGNRPFALLTLFVFAVLLATIAVGVIR